MSENKKLIKILMIDDEADLTKQICEYLSLEDFITEELNNPERALEVITLFKPDVLILDKNMPGKDGIDVLRDIRENSDNKELPVLMLTACNTKFDKLWAFKYGVDDFLLKPFDIEELTMRLRALSKRVQTSPSSQVSLPEQNVTSPVCLGKRISQDSLNIEVKGQFITLGDKEVQLTDFEFEFLKELIQREGSVFSTIEIQELLTKSNASLEKIQSDISILKNKLDYVGSKIKEIRGVGYRLAS